MGPKQLPRIIGVIHDFRQQTLAERIIDDLPANSKVGLEMGLKKNFENEPEIIEGLEPLDNYFSELGEYAEKKGHTVVWIEKKGSNLPTGIRKSVVKFAKSPLRSDKLRISRNNLNRQLNVTKWRSGIMARLIKREDWKPTDAVFVGVGHAVHLRRMLRTNVEYALTYPNWFAQGWIIQPGAQLSAKGDLKLQSARKAVKLLKKNPIGKKFLGTYLGRKLTR